MIVVWILTLVFWTPAHTHPTKVETFEFDTFEECAGAADTKTDDWKAMVKGGDTSWACNGAVAPSST